MDSSARFRRARATCVHVLHRDSLRHSASRFETRLAKW